MRRQRLIGISAAHRAAARISEGDIIEVDVEIDDAPRVVLEPADLADALNNCPEARTSFDSLPFGLRQTHVNTIQEARVRSHFIDYRMRHLIQSMAAAMAMPAAKDTAVLS